MEIKTCDIGVLWGSTVLPHERWSTKIDWPTAKVPAAALHVQIGSLRGYID